MPHKTSSARTHFKLWAEMLPVLERPPPETRPRHQLKTQPQCQIRGSLLHPIPRLLLLLQHLRQDQQCLPLLVSEKSTVWKISKSYNRKFIWIWNFFVLLQACNHCLIKCRKILSLCRTCWMLPTHRLCFKPWLRTPIWLPISYQVTHFLPAIPNYRYFECTLWKFISSVSVYNYVKLISGTNEKQHASLHATIAKSCRSRIDDQSRGFGGN